MPDADRQSFPFLEPSWPGVERLRRGAFTLDLAADGFRNLGFDGRVVMAALYPAVRASDWSTVSLAPKQWRVDEGPASWELTVKHELPGRYHAVTALRLIDDASVLVCHRLHPLVDEWVNRWGLNLCLDADTWAGSGIVVDGRQDQLPRGIGPQRSVGGQVQALFPAGHQVEVQHPSRARLVVVSTGLELEVEDQRNWTDPTFKIYGGSLQAPRPVLLPAGSVWRQELRLDWHAPAQREASLMSSARTLGPVVELPQVGVQLNDTAGWPADAVGEALGDLAVAHVRLDLERPDVDRRVGAFPDLGVELAVLDPGSEHDDRVEERVCALLEKVESPVRILWHRDHRRTTDSSDIKWFRTRCPSLKAALVPGTDAYFVDLNRDRPHVDGWVSFSICPTVHTSDDQTVFASLATQAEVVRQAREVFGPPVVSPITFGVRGAPESVHDAAHRATLVGADARLSSLIGAAWTLGSIHAVTQAGAACGTWHELLGAAGLLAGSPCDPVVGPAFHAIAALQANRQSRVQTLNSAGASWIGLVLVDIHRLLVVSLRPWLQTVTLEGVPPVTSRRRLRTADLACAGRTRRWWRDGPSEQYQDRFVDLEPFEISLFELAAK